MTILLILMLINAALGVFINNRSYRFFAFGVGLILLGLIYATYINH